MVQLQDIEKYRFLSGLTYSPAGNNAAFVVHQADAQNNGYLSYIYLYNENKNHIKITHWGLEKDFLWLDDCHILAEGPPTEEIKAKIALGEEWTTFYKINVQSQQSEVYMTIPLKVSGIKAITPESFAIQASRDIHRPDLYTLTEVQRQQEINTRKMEQDYLVLEEIPFCQNGVGYVSARRNSLYHYDIPLDKVTLVSDIYEDVTFFETGQGKILYGAVAYQDIRTNAQGIYTYDPAKGHRETILPQGPYVIDYCNFIENGNFVMIGWPTATYEYTNNPAVYEVSADAVRLICSPDLSLDNSVSSDVRYGSCQTRRVAGNNLFTVSTGVTGSVIRKITLEGTVEALHQMDGSVDCFDVRNGNILFAGQRELRLQELYRLKDGGEEQVSSFNEGLYDSNELSTPIHMAFPNGGYNVHYLVLKPVNFDPEKKYPAVFYIHGGAKVIFGPVFHHEMQLLAANGYFVIYGDPRGSDGQGTAFARLKGQYGVSDYDDMMKAVDTALATFPQIDKDNIACVGGSYGGLMTNLIIGRTHRFKCAIAQRSISNMITNFSATDNGINFVADQMCATPWVNYEGIWDISPLKHADKVRTPLLLIHAELDFRCHYIEAIQMFNALKFHGVESRLVLIKGENHDLSRTGRPQQRYRRLNEILAWLNSHLKEVR